MIITKFQKKTGILAILTLSLLMIPLIAMQFNSEVNWTLFDFIFAGVLLFGTSTSFLFITNKVQNKLFKLATTLALGTALFLVWANLAVGIIGSEDESINIYYFLVILIEIVGASIARFKPLGMSYTLFATATSQAVLTVVALILGYQNLAYSSIQEIVLVNAFFTGLFIISGVLYYKVYKKEKK